MNLRSSSVEVATMRSKSVIAATIVVCQLVLSNGRSIDVRAFGGQAASISAGQLDPEFGTNGKVFTAFGVGGEANAVALQSDGKIVAAGYISEEIADEAYSTSFAIARYESDGSLDAAFGVGAKVITGFSGREALASAVAIQPDGKIVAAGESQRVGDQSSTDFALARYDVDGTLDANFGNGGKVTTDFFGQYDVATALALQPDGKILAAGFSQRTGSYASGDFGLVRYNADGSLDQTFGLNGFVTTDFFGGSDSARAIGLQLDGRIALAGSADRPVPGSPTSTSSVDFALARYNPEGTPDASFGEGGKITSNLLGNIEEALALRLQPDGRLVAAGGAARNFGFGSGALALTRYDPHGAIDATFVTIGKDTPDSLIIRGYAKALALQPDGKIVATGGVKVCGGINCEDFLVARFNSDGGVDKSFGNGGQVNTDFFDRFDSANAVAIQPDGKIIACGSASGENSIKGFALARYLPEPNFLIAFDTPTINVSRGTKAPVKLKISRISGFAGEVTVTPSDTSALRIGINPALVKTSGATANFKIKVKSNAPTGAQQIIFTGTDAAGRVRTSILNVVVE